MSSNETLKAIAVANSYTTSAVGTVAIDSGAHPDLHARCGQFLGDAIGATIYYTTDGTYPTKSSFLYSGPISVNSSGKLKAIATASGLEPSTVGIAAYTITQ